MLDGRVGFHSSSCLEGRLVHFRVPSTRNFEAIRIALDELSLRFGQWVFPSY